MAERVRGMKTDLVMTDDPPDIRICKPGRERRILTHKEAYQIMMETGPNSEGRYLDPVSNRLFPVGRTMLEKPNRKQRRRLEAWRRTGRVKGLARCEVQG